MPVRPSSSSEPEDTRNWIWPQGDGTRAPRYAVGSESGARRGSLRFIRELRLWEDADRQLQQPADPGDPVAHLCEEEDAEDELAVARQDATTMELEQTVPQTLQKSTVFREGAAFEGSQRVARESVTHGPEDWGVVVIIHEIDLQHGRCSGDMMAKNVPLAKSPIITHWEGDIIDGVNNSFVTCKWGAPYSTDLAHWREFHAFAPLNRKVVQSYGRCNTLHECPYIFMRWKEMFFVNEREEGCSLTIAGFYYVCLCRKTGKIEGFYWDPNSTPFQKLELRPASSQPTFSRYTFA